MCHKFITTMRFSIALLAALPLTCFSQELGDALFTVGTSMEDSDGDGQAWVYLLWQTAQLDQLMGREFAIYSKPGEPDSASPYVFDGSSRMRLDPAAIRILINRGAKVGDEELKLESDIDKLFHQMIPDPTIPLEEKISAVVEGCLADPEQFENLVFISRTHVTISLVIGTGFTMPYPEGQIRTWEIRECPSVSILTEDCDNVLARITLEVGFPMYLPAPGRPVYVPFVNDSGDPDPRAHLNVPVRWSSPDDLRRRSLLQFGYNLYRMPAEVAYDAGFDTTPPTPFILADLADDPGHPVTRVNSVPIITSVRLTDSESLDTVADPRTYHYIDDNGRFLVGGVPFANGEEYFYFVTARDILGRDGEVSDGTLVRICDLMPPPQPRNTVVENHYTFDNGTRSNRQYLKVSWDAPNLSNSQTPEIIAGYYVYRWWSIEEMQQMDSVPYDAATATSGGLVDIVPADQFEYIDDGATAPYLETIRIINGSRVEDLDNANKTFWYTVRAIDESDCGGNLSGNSAPAYGVLRDRTGPPPTSGEILIDCLDVDVIAPFEVQPGIPWENPPETGITYLQLEGKRRDSDVLWVEFGYFAAPNPAMLVQPRYYFNNPEDSTIVRVKLPQPSNKDLLFVACRMGTMGGKVSEWNSLQIPFTDNEYSAYNVFWEGFTEIIETPAGGDCVTHTTVGPGTQVNDIVVTFGLTPGTEEWKVYRRVGDGQMTMIAQGLDSYDQASSVAVADANMPAKDVRVCYFVQLFDQHGNPGPMEPLGCSEVTGKEELPEPMLSRPAPLGTESDPQALVSWFCSPYGVEYFEVWISSDSETLPVGLGDDFEQPGIGSTEAGRFWKSFRSKRIATTWPGNTPEFSTVMTGVELGERYVFKVRAIGPSGTGGEFSNEEEFVWNPDTSETVTGPNVPWPALGLPRVANSFNERLIAKTVDKVIFDGGTIRLADLEYVNIDNPVNAELPSDFFFPQGTIHPDDLTYTNDNGDSLFPFVLYRYQVPNAQYPLVSGDVYQVSPMMETIAAIYESIPIYKIFAFNNYDPFFILVDDPKVPGNVFELLVKDTQPLLSGGRYRYLIVRFDPLSKEIVEIIPTNVLDIP